MPEEEFSVKKSKGKKKLICTRADFLQITSKTLTYLFCCCLVTISLSIQNKYLHK